MAKFKPRRPNAVHPTDDEPPRQPDGEPAGEDARRETVISNPQWQDWFRNLGGKADADRVEMVDLVYAISDAHTQARAMKLDFLSYLLAMALQEAMTQLRAREPSN